MRLEGFVGPAYTLDSLNVDCQRCVNLCPEVIESGMGKEKAQYYLRGTPGLELVAEVGNGPIRLVHTDSIGRVLVVSGNQFYSLSKKIDWRYQFTPDVGGAKAFGPGAINTTTDVITLSAHGWATGLKVRLTISAGPNIAAPLVVGLDYYVVRVDANSFKLAISYANALAGTTINITTQGDANITATPQSYATIRNLKHVEINFDDNSFYKPSHGYFNGMPVSFKATGVVPSALTEGTTYYVANVSTDSFQLASSLTNAIAGTEINIIDVDDQWNVKLMGDKGEYGGATVILPGSIGQVKAASMSFGGDGTDSSTVFVDGEANYLLKDNVGDQSLSIMGEIKIAQTVIDASDDITVQVATNVDDTLANGIFEIYTRNAGVALGRIRIEFRVSLNRNYQVQVSLDSGQTLTTAQLVDFLNTGNKSGKNILLNSDTSITTTPLSPGSLVFMGGGSESVASAFPYPGVQQGWTAGTWSGFGYGSVPTATQIVWSDGYFILNEFGTNRFWVSDLQDFNVNSLSFSSSEGNPDILLALIISNRYLYAFNEKTTEVYANTGNPDFPFERIQGGMIEVGLAAEYSVAKLGDIVCWLGRTSEGHGMIYAAEGMSPQRISTHAIEQAISTYADISTAKAYAYQQNGHTFYVLNFAEATWVFDFSTRLWHERAYTNEGDLERHRAECYTRDIKRGYHLVGDYETNEVFALKDSIFTDNGDAITRMRVSPHGSAELNQIFYSRFQLDMETGVGLDGDVQGSDPQVVLDYSDNKGRTWSSENWALADAGGGEIGDFNKRVIWRRLGRSRDRVWRVRITDPVKVVLLGAYVDAEMGAS